MIIKFTASVMNSRELQAFKCMTDSVLALTICLFFSGNDLLNTADSLWGYDVLQKCLLLG